MDDTILFVIVGALVVLALAASSQIKKNDQGLIKDESVDTDGVINILKEFQIKQIEGRKNGFTELDIEKQLEENLKSVFEHVTRQHAVGGTNVKKIDLDVGRGRVGIELKLASDVIKEGGNDRLMGQVVKYKNRQYTNDNLIIAVAGYGYHERETALSDLKDWLLEQKVKYVFLNADKEINPEQLIKDN